MGISLANVLTPFIDRRQPRVVITGAFPLGLVKHTSGSGYSLRLADRLILEGVATSTTGFWYKLAGRVGYSDYESPRGLTNLATQSYMLVKDFDYQAAVRIISDGGLGSYSAGVGTTELLTAAEEEAHTDFPQLGTLIAPEVTITIFGKLTKLDLSEIKVGAWLYDGRTIKGKDGNTTNVWYKNYYYQLRNGMRNHWHCSGVHIFNNPKLQGNVKASDIGGTIPVYWDS
jgi:hypothetical protein